MNAIKFIIREHRKIRRTFGLIKKKARIETQQKLFDKLCQYLVMHETMEHVRWYPHFKNNKAVASVVKMLLSEEKAAAAKIKQFKKTNMSDAMWKKNFLAFNKAVLQHASDEEKKLFPKVAKLLTEEELKKIGKTLKAYKKSHNKSKL